MERSHTSRALRNSSCPNSGVGNSGRQDGDEARALVGARPTSLAVGQWGPDAWQVFSWSRGGNPP